MSDAAKSKDPQEVREMKEVLHQFEGVAKRTARKSQVSHRNLRAVAASMLPDAPPVSTPGTRVPESLRR